MRKAIYLIIFAAIIIGILISFNKLNVNSYVKVSDADVESTTLWNSKIATTVNAKPIKLMVDESEIVDSNSLIYMSETLMLMIPIDNISSAFNCAVNLYDKQNLVIEKGNNTIKLKINSSTIQINDNMEIIKDSFVLEDGTYYVPLEAILNGFEYDYLWESVNNTAILTSKNPGDATLPEYYNYADNNRLPSIKDQGNLGTCWAFAALTAIESSLLPEEEYDFSEDHMTLNNNYNISPKIGGKYTMAIAYLNSWSGPVLEVDDPYNDGITTNGLTPLKHVQEVQVLESKDYDMIKRMVYKYGAVQSSIYMSTTARYTNESAYYNKNTYAYCYTGEAKANHDIVIIGWDNNYSKDNFSISVAGDGAFICRNSWGDDFGDDGNFYISYYDVLIGTNNAVYTRIDDIDNYDNIYQTDLCGWIGQLGYGKETAYFANVYKAKKKEKLQAVGFYATGPNTEYSIYVITDYENSYSLNVTEDPVLSGKFTNAGYYTVDLKKAIALSKDSKYAIIVKVTTPKAQRPVAIEYISNEQTQNVDISDGEGYISLRGLEWESVEDEHECNVCLKAYTKDVR